MGDLESNVRIGLVAVNLVIWTGLFFYILRLSRRVRELEDKERKR